MGRKLIRKDGRPLTDAEKAKRYRAAAALRRKKAVVALKQARRAATLALKGVDQPGAEVHDVRAAMIILPEVPDHLRCCGRLKLRWIVRCSRRSKVERAGFGFCGIHDPGPDVTPDQAASLSAVEHRQEHPA